MNYYLKQLDSIVFENSVEIDESYLFKPKPSLAPHRGYANALWVFRIYQRDTKKFIIFPVTSRRQENLLHIIFKFIKPGTLIYSDSFTVYVNNRVRLENQNWNNITIFISL